MNNRILTFDEFINEQLLTENLIPADLDFLENVLYTDEKNGNMILLKDKSEITLRKFLDLKAKELVNNFPEYRYLVQELDLYLNSTLMHLIIGSIVGKKDGYISKFSIANEKIKGFVAYKLLGNEVTNIKMFSFDPVQSGGSTLYRDLDRLLEIFMNDKKISKISWDTIKENPANKAYQKVINKYKGTVEKVNDIMHYCIMKA